MKMRASLPTRSLRQERRAGDDPIADAAELDQHGLLPDVA